MKHSETSPIGAGTCVVRTTHLWFTDDRPLITVDLDLGRWPYPLTETYGAVIRRRRFWRERTATAEHHAALAEAKAFVASFDEPVESVMRPLL